MIRAWDLFSFGGELRKSRDQIFFYYFYFLMVSKQLWLFLNSSLKIVQINLALEDNSYHKHSLGFSLEENTCTDADVHKTGVYLC